MPTTRRKPASALTPPSTCALLTFLKEDGHALFRTSDRRNERSLDCFSPYHQDDGLRSMRAYLKHGTYRCKGCGIQGNALSYLRQQRRLEDYDAFALLKSAGWTQSMIQRADAQDKQSLPSGLQWVEAIPDIFPFEGLRKEAEYSYRVGERAVMTRAIYAGPLGGGSQRRRSLTFCQAPSRGGGYWVADAIDPGLPLQDRLVDAYPLYRIDDALTRLEQSTHNWIWVVPDEEVCNAVGDCEDYPDGPIPCTCLYDGEHTRVEDHDIGPLIGKRVLLIPSQDEVCRSYMGRFKQELDRRGITCICRVSPGNTGQSIGDAITRHGMNGARAWLENSSIGNDLRPAPASQQGNSSGNRIEDNPHFVVMGILANMVAFRLKRTQEVVYVPRDLLANVAHLLSLAPLNWWLTLASAEEKLTDDQRVWLCDRIFQAAASKGFIQMPDRSFGRGAFSSDHAGSRAGFNLGDRLLLHDDDLLTREAPLDALDMNLLPGCPLPLHDDPKAEDYGKALTEALLAYRWARSEDGKAFLGWIVTALIGGALRFRPALWLAAGPGSGKTYLIDVLDDIFGPFAVRYLGVLRPDGACLSNAESLPCLVDLPDRNRNEQQRQKALELLAGITAGRGRLARTGLPRCSLIFASRSVPPLSAEESQRLMVLRFGLPVADWPAVDSSIVEATRPYKMLALRTRIIRHASRIARKAREIEHAQLRRRAKGSATRQAQLMGALTAGYGFLSGDFNLIRRSDDVVPDEYAVLEALLGKQAPAPNGEGHTIAELLTASDPRLNAIALDFGFKLIHEQGLAIAHSHENLRALLDDTPFANLDIGAYLEGIGARVWETANGNPGRLSSGGRRYVCRLVSKELLNEVGFGH